MKVKIYDFIFHSLDIRFCDIIQHNLVALYVPFGEGIGQHNGQITEFRMALSMFVDNFFGIKINYKSLF